MTLYFQVHFLRLKYLEYAKSTIKNVFESERKKKVSSLKQNISKDQKINARS